MTNKRTGWALVRYGAEATEAGTVHVSVVVVLYGGFDFHKWLDAWQNPLEVIAWRNDDRKKGR